MTSSARALRGASRSRAAARACTLGALALSALLLAPTAWPCGPVFPTSILDSQGMVLETPATSFLAEVRKLSSLPDSPFEAVESYRSSRLTAETGRQQLLEALGLEPRDARDDPRVAAYDELRRNISIHQEALLDWQYDLRWAGTDHGPKPVLPEVALPAGLPPEFDLYLRGAVAYHRQDHDSARRAWTELLALPEDQRRRRTVWAQFMLARIGFDEAEARLVARDTPDAPPPVDPQADAAQRANDEAALRTASQRFAETRELVTAGYPDPLGLAEDSLGWEARGEWRLGRWGRAIELYGRQVASGDRGADTSLHEVCRRAVLAGGKALETVAASPFAREVMSLYLAGHREVGGREVEVAESWTERLEDHGVQTVASAGLVAWVAYQAARFGEADRWTDLAAEDDSRALWVRAKLRLREGRLDEAAELLESLEQDVFGARAEGEAGVIYLAQGNYPEAIDRLLRAGYWTDAAYVAERLLTLEELQSYVDANWPHELPDENPYWVAGTGVERPTDGWIAWRIRHLLGRRLTRAGRWRDAVSYLPGPRLPATARQVADWLECGDDPGCPRERRAEGLWRAAQTLRSEGMELLGSALYPDYRMWGGNYGGALDFPKRQDYSILPASAEQIERWRQSAIEPDRRYHYRFLAADLAWRAAELMPDGDPDTAWVLTVGGGWIKYLDPPAADRFYKALVRRCGNTALGREAERRRWFPPV